MVQQNEGKWTERTAKQIKTTAKHKENKRGDNNNNRLLSESKQRQKEKEAERSQMQGLPERPASSCGDVIADESFREAHAGGGEQTQYLERTSAEGQASQQAATGLSCD